MFLKVNRVLPCGKKTETAVSAEAIQWLQPTENSAFPGARTVIYTGGETEVYVVESLDEILDAIKNVSEK